MPKGYSALAVLRACLHGCSVLHLRKSQPLFSLGDLKMLFFRLLLIKKFYFVGWLLKFLNLVLYEYVYLIAYK